MYDSNRAIGMIADEMGIAYSALNKILNARRPVTEKTALLFEAALGVNAEPLLKMQMRYSLQSTKKDSSFMARADASKCVRLQKF